MKETQSRERLRFAAFLDQLTSEVKSRRQLNDFQQFSADRLLLRPLKRAEALGDVDLLEKSSVEEFFARNSSVRTPNLSSFEISSMREFISNMLWRQSTALGCVIPQTAYDLDFLDHFWRYGPGASNGVHGTHTAEKIYQPMACTAAAEPYVLALRRAHPYLSQHAHNDRGCAVVDGSKLATVPKNESVRRVIAVEPCGNMVLQLSVGRFLEDALRRVGTDISNQQVKNQQLAKRGSIDGSLATIDFSGASDSISNQLVELLLPKELYSVLRTIRSPVTNYKGDQRDLNMISMMGNGFTFPLMTMLLLSAVYHVTGGQRRWIDYKTVGVFGDDVILPTRHATAFIDLATRMGFDVNQSKSFTSGPFRESCGGDFYKGYDCTPFYVKSLATDSSLFVALNQVLRWSSKHDVCTVQTLRLLKSFLKGKAHLIPQWMDPSYGVQTLSVPRRFSYLHSELQSKILKDEYFLMTLACGGYVTSSKKGALYTPREARRQYRVRRSRIPQGYVDGWSPDWGPVEAASRADFWLALS